MVQSAADTLGQGEALGGAVVGEEIAVAGDRLEGAAGEEDEVADVAVAQGLVGRDVGEPFASGGGPVVGREVDEELDDAPGLGPRGRRRRRRGDLWAPLSPTAMVGSPRSPRMIGSLRLVRPGGVTAPSKHRVRLVGRLGVGGGFGEVEEGFDVGQRLLGRRVRVDRLEVLAGEGRLAGSMTSPAPAGARGPAVTRRSVGPLAQLGELAGDHSGVDQDDGLFSPGLMWLRARRRGRR